MCVCVCGGGGCPREAKAAQGSTPTARGLPGLRRAASVGGRRGLVTCIAAHRPRQAPQHSACEDRAALDDDLRALGMLSCSGPALDAVAGPQSSGPSAAAARPYLQEGVEGADDVVVVDRVSPEEEERHTPEPRASA